MRSYSSLHLLREHAGESDRFVLEFLQLGLTAIRGVLDASGAVRRLVGRARERERGARLRVNRVLELVLQRLAAVAALTVLRVAEERPHVAEVGAVIGSRDALGLGAALNLAAAGAGGCQGEVGLVREHIVRGGPLDEDVA